MLFGRRKGLSIGMITGIQASFDTKFVNGSGVGSSSRSAHHAKSRRAYITPGAVYTIPPQPPTNILVSLVNGAVQVSWTAPTSVGDSPISSEFFIKYVARVIYLIQLQLDFTFTKRRRFPRPTRSNISHN